MESCEFFVFFYGPTRLLCTQAKKEYVFKLTHIETQNYKQPSKSIWQARNLAILLLDNVW